MRGPLPSPAMWLALLLSACATGCQPVPVVTARPVPSTERLIPSDCDQGAREYRQRLTRPATAEDGAAPNPETDRLVSDFQAACQAHLAGKARRVILRCWHDAVDAADLLACNGRF